MRYALAWYCSDLTNSKRDFIPVGVLVVDEKAQKYAFKHLSDLPTSEYLDFMTIGIWRTIPTLVEQRFAEYRKEPNHKFYQDRLREYHGFISQRQPRVPTTGGRLRVLNTSGMLASLGALAFKQQNF